MRLLVAVSIWAGCLLVVASAMAPEAAAAKISASQSVEKATYSRPLYPSWVLTDLKSRGMTCEQCVPLIDALAAASKSQSALDLINKMLDGACEQYIKDPTDQANCKKLAADAVKLLPWAAKSIGELSWDSFAVCSVFIPVCKQPCCKPDNTPEQVHIAIGDRPSMMTVTWATLTPTPGSRVEYGTGPGQLNMTASSQARTYTDGGWVGVIQQATMTGLQPGTTYYYRVNGGATAPSVGPFRFSTIRADAGSEAAPLRIVQIGDMDFDVMGKGTVAAVTALVEKGLVDVVLHVGDIGYADGYEAHWDAFFRRIEPIASRVPYMVAPGNHEFWFNFSSYKTRFSMPSRVHTLNMYYSLDIGGGESGKPVLHLQMLNSESPIDTAYMDPAQVAWIAADLATQPATSSAWRISTFHRPFYCTDHVKLQCETYAALLRSMGEKQLFEGKVDLVLMGHVHAYERTWPVFNSQPTGTSYDRPAAPVYIVNGAGGNRENNGPVRGDKPWSAFNSAAVGFLSLVVTERQLAGQFIESATGAVLDSFVLTK